MHRCAFLLPLVLCGCATDVDLADETATSTEAAVQLGTVYEHQLLLSGPFRVGDPADGDLGTGFNVQEGTTCHDAAFSDTHLFTSSARDLAAACRELAVARAQPFPSTLEVCTNITSSVAARQCSPDALLPLGLCSMKVERGPRLHSEGKPPFIVHSFQYQLPGNRSTLTYAEGDSSGSTWETRWSESIGVDFSWGSKLTGGLGGSTSFKFQHDSSRRGSLQQTSSFSERLSYTTDVADHARDVVTLWVNPRVDLYGGCNGDVDVMHWNVAIQPWVDPAFDPRLPVMMDFTVGELLDPARVTDHYRKLFLSRLTADDIEQGILALDPFYDRVAKRLIANPVLDPDRFRPVQGESCPRNLPHPVTSTRSLGCRATYSESNEQTDTYRRDWNVETKYTGFDDAMGASLGGKFSLTYSRTRTQSAGNNNSAELTLSTSTPGICIDGQLALDTLFNVYVVSSSVRSCQQLAAERDR
jgi:hypothetical protein